MNQSDHSNFVFEYLRIKHPEFLPTVDFKDNQSFDCRVESPYGSLFLWVATYDCEITLGFEYSDGNCPWHTHMSLFGAYEPEEEVQAMTELLQGIYSGKKLIVFSTADRVFITDNPEKELAGLENGELLEFKTWQDL